MKQYTEDDAPDSLTNDPRVPGEILSIFVYEILFNPDPVKHLENGLLSAKVSGQEDLDGEPGTVVDITRNAEVVYK